MTSVRKRRQPLDIQFGQRVDLSTIDRLCTEWTGSTGSAKAVFAKIARRADYDKWDCYPAQRTIAKDAGVGVSTVIRAICKLKTLGVLEVLSVGTGRDPTKYRVRFDRIAADIAGSTLATYTGQDDRCTPPPRRVSPVTVKGKQFQENKPKATAAAAEALAGFETTLATDELAEAVRNACGSNSKAVVAAAMTDHVRAWYAIERVQDNPTRFKNASGWILKAIRDLYDIPANYVTPPDRRAKQQAREEAEVAALEAERTQRREAERRACTEAALDRDRKEFLTRDKRCILEAAVRLVTDREDAPFKRVTTDMVLSDEIVDRARSRPSRRCSWSDLAERDVLCDDAAVLGLGLWCAVGPEVHVSTIERDDCPARGTVVTDLRDVVVPARHRVLRVIRSFDWITKVPGRAALRRAGPQLLRSA